MIRISIIGYCTGSIFVSTLNHEMFWALISTTIAVDVLGKKIRAEEVEKFELSQQSSSFSFSPKEKNKVKKFSI
jgi:hypothetical protein